MEQTREAFFEDTRTELGSLHGQITRLLAHYEMIEKSPELRERVLFLLHTNRGHVINRLMMARVGIEDVQMVSSLAVECIKS